MKKLFSTLFVSFLIGVVMQAHAQSVFEGFSGQFATGYESNQASNLDMTFSSDQNWMQTIKHLVAYHSFLVWVITFQSGQNGSLE